MQVEAAAGDLGDHVRRGVEDVLVGRGPGGAGLGVHAREDSAAGGGCHRGSAGGRVAGSPCGC